MEVEVPKAAEKEKERKARKAKAKEVLRETLRGQLKQALIKIKIVKTLHIQGENRSFGH